jgi:TolA-binding protein
MMTVDTLSDVGQLLLGGIRAFTAGRYDEAVLEFKKVLATHPSGTVAVHCMYNIGICYLKLRLLGDAENQFQLVLDRYSSHPLAPNCLFLKAVTYLERSEPETAEKLLRKFIQEYRNHRWVANAWEKLGDAYVNMEQHRKAADAYAQAVALCKRNSDKVAVSFKLGKAFLDIGNGIRAIESFQHAIETGEKANVFLRVPDSYYRIADEFYRTKDYLKALDYYTRVTRKYPSFQETPWGLFQIGSINKNLKKFREAIDAFKELADKFPDDYWARQAQWKMEDAVWENEYKAVLR